MMLQPVQRGQSAASRSPIPLQCMLLLLMQMVVGVAKRVSLSPSWSQGKHYPHFTAPWTLLCLQHRTIIITNGHKFIEQVCSIHNHMFQYLDEATNKK